MEKQKIKVNEDAVTTKLVAVEGIEPHTDVFGTDGMYHVTDDERHADVSNAKDKWRHLGKIPFTPAVVKRNGKFLCISRYECVLAAKELKIAAVPVDVVDVADEDIKAWAAQSYDHTDERYSYVRRGRECLPLILYAEKYWKQIKRDNPKIEKQKNWVAWRLGWRSDDSIYKLETIVNHPDGMALLARIDAMEPGMSLESVFSKVTNKPDAPKPSTLSKETIKCNCPIEEGCPRLKAYREGKEDLNEENEKAA